jgi:hypothetical protein
MLDQREITLVQRIFLCFVPVVQRHLFAIVNQAGVLEAELAFQARLISDVSTEGRSQRAHDVRRELHEERHEEEPFAANAAG